MKKENEPNKTNLNLPVIKPKDPFITIKKGIKAGVSVLNGWMGDYLHRKQNDLAIQMQFYVQHQPLQLSAEAIKAVQPNPSSKICILIHGLMNDEQIWNFYAPANTNYGTLLQRDLGYTPFYLHYNTGLHISENGKFFSELIEHLHAVYPVFIEEISIIAHSMGGLVTRSACHYATEQQSRWVKKVRNLFFLGTPHLGAPLEKIGNITTAILKAIPLPHTQFAGDIINMRSSGIKDLRFGYTSDADWKNKNPNALLENNKTTLPLLEYANYYIITGTLSPNPDDMISHILGDVLVRKPSATGHSNKQEHKIPFSLDKNHREFAGVGHIKLAHSADVYQQIKAWAAATPHIDFTDKTLPEKEEKYGSHQPKEVNTTQQLMGLTHLLQAAVDKGTTEVEKVHTIIADEFVGTGKLQKRLTSMVYNSIRRVNKQGGNFLRHWLDKLK